MARQDTTDFLMAFAVGTVLGIGATLLLRPAPKSPRERLTRELRPYGRRLRRDYGEARELVRDAAEAAGGATGEVISVGKELLGEFRDEVRRILEDARDELKAGVEDQARAVRRRARRAGKKLGM